MNIRHKYLPNLSDLQENGFLVWPLKSGLGRLAVEAVQDFYDQPLADRAALVPDGFDPMGYTPSEAETDDLLAMRSKVPASFTGQRRRGYASFDFLATPASIAPSGLVGSPMSLGDVGLQRRVAGVTASLRQLASHIAFALWDAISAEFGAPGWPRSALSGQTCSITRLLRYRPGELEISKAHTDYEFIALIISDEPGLEVRNHRDDWSSVDAPSGCVIVLPGDMMGLATDGAIGASVHRVRCNGRLRHAFIQFQGLAYQTALDHPAMTTFGNHLCGMLVRGAPRLAAAHAAGLLPLSFQPPLHNPVGVKAHVF